jgi:hypothetical protein
MLIFGFVGYALAGDMTVVGTIGDDKTITDEAGTVYMIGESVKSEEVVVMSGKKVEVMGMVEEATDGSKTIMIEAYKVVE